MNEDALEWMIYMIEEAILTDPMLLAVENYIDILEIRRQKFINTHLRVNISHEVLCFWKRVPWMPTFLIG